MRTAEEIANEIFLEMDDFSQSMINPELLTVCVQAGIDEAAQEGEA